MNSAMVLGYRSFKSGLLGALALSLLTLTSTAAKASPVDGEVAAAPFSAARSGGATTVFDSGQNAFGRSLGNLEPERWPEMQKGKRIFVHRFQPADESAQPDPDLGRLDGLGPLFNADSCSACHFKDGRGRRPEDPAPSPPLIYRWMPTSPEFGIQLQDRAVPGATPEGSIEVTTRKIEGRYADGEIFTLHQPEYRWQGPATLDPEIGWSARQPPTLVGMGLLEAVPDHEILAWRDDDDLDGDGISGRPQWLEDGNGRRLGRFGWQAGQASLRDQTVAALAEDMGIRAGAASPELSPENLRLLVLYLQLLAPPARRDVEEPALRRGEQLFATLGCESCHRPQMRTGSQREIPGPPELAEQTIHPYTDLLLHDMGEGLADASGREWRTSPLWGLGLLERVSGELRLLHDGRARSFEEAILWHGGEALDARRSFVRLSATDRADLVRFLMSL